MWRNGGGGVNSGFSFSMFYLIDLFFDYQVEPFGGGFALSTSLWTTCPGNRATACFNWLARSPDRLDAEARPVERVLAAPVAQHHLVVVARNSG